ncbi:MAG: hypothetical protein AAGF75_13245 [Cyanobacteria bacterium P01_H01_bin.130]
MAKRQPPIPIPITVEPHWLQEGLAIASEQSDARLGKVALLNHLAMAAAGSLLQWLEIPCGACGDRPPVSLWGVLDFAALDVVRGDDSGMTAGMPAGMAAGKILCRPVVLPSADVDADGGSDDGVDDGTLICELPLDLPEETVACVPVGFDESLKQAWIWGYVPVAAFEVGVRGAQAFRFDGVPWRSLEALAADLERWIGLSQVLATQTDLCDRLSTWVGPVPLVSLVARWRGDGTGANLLGQYRQTYGVPLEELGNGEEGDETEKESSPEQSPALGRVRESSKGSSTYRIDEDEEADSVGPQSGATDETTEDAGLEAADLDAIAQALDQWFQGMDDFTNPI